MWSSCPHFLTRPPQFWSPCPSRPEVAILYNLLQSAPWGATPLHVLLTLVLASCGTLQGVLHGLEFIFYFLCLSSVGEGGLTKWHLGRGARHASTPDT